MGSISNNLQPATAILRSRRAYLDLTQEDLARLAKTSKQTICEIERGNQRPNRWTLYAICDSLSLPSKDTEKVFRAFGHGSIGRMDAIGLHINALRRNKGLSQGDMAERIGVTRSAISKAEQGKKVVSEVAPLVYDFFEVPASERLPYENHEHPKAENIGNTVPEGELTSCVNT